MESNCLETARVCKKRPNTSGGDKFWKFIDSVDFNYSLGLGQFAALIEGVGDKFQNPSFDPSLKSGAYNKL